MQLSEPYLLVLVDSEGDWHVAATTWRTYKLVMDLLAALPPRVKGMMSMMEVPGSGGWPEGMRLEVAALLGLAMYSWLPVAPDRPMSMTSCA